MKVFFETDQNITAGSLAEMCGGNLLNGGNGLISVRGICTDSREADAQTAFVALQGERTDGHAYIATAVENGCRCVICERAVSVKENTAVIVTENSELALSRLARAYGNTLSCKKIAVTGSVGKTTAKDLIAAVISEYASVYQSKGNHNSVIGMPLSMLEIAPETEYAVLEMGMSGFGEIERMSLAAQPDIAVITNIGTSHMEMLGSRENICRAKLEIVCGLRDGGYLIINGDEPLLHHVSGKNYRTVSVSVEHGSADYFAQNIRVESDGTRFDICWNGQTCKDCFIRVLGKHNVYAALYAFAVGILIGMTPEEIRHGYLRFSPSGMRQNVYSLYGMTVIEDCYNAAPESMRAAIDVLSEYAKRTNARSVAVLGDMLELGEESDTLHRMVGAYLAHAGVDLLVTVGERGLAIAAGAADAGMNPTHIFSHKNRDEIAVIGQILFEQLQNGDVVLWKASRSVGLECLISDWKDRIDKKTKT